MGVASGGLGHYLVVEANPQPHQATMTEPNEPETLWTAEEVAAYLKVSVLTVQKWARAGRIPGRKAGVLNRFDRREIEEWTRTTGPEPED